MLMSALIFELMPNRKSGICRASLHCVLVCVCMETFMNTMILFHPLFSACVVCACVKRLVFYIKKVLNATAMQFNGQRQWLHRTIPHCPAVQHAMLHITATYTYHSEWVPTANTPTTHTQTHAPHTLSDKSACTVHTQHLGLGVAVDSTMPAMTGRALHMGVVHQHHNCLSTI